MPIRPENRDRYPADWAQISERIRFTRAAGRCECEGECGRWTHCHLGYDRQHHAQTAARTREALRSAGMAPLFPEAVTRG